MKKYSRSAMLALTVATLCLVLPLQGCIGQAALASLTNILGTQAANIANLEGNDGLAVQLKLDTSAAVTAITNWKSGTPTQDVIQVLSIVEDDLNLIPGTSKYAPLVDIAIATVQSILALLPAPPANTMKVHRSRTVSLGHPAPKSEKEFKKMWNNAVAKNPALAPALIK